MGRQYQALLLLANNFKVFYKDTTGTVHNTGIIQNITEAYFSGTVVLHTSLRVDATITGGIPNKEVSLMVSEISNTEILLFRFTVG